MAFNPNAKPIDTGEIDAFGDKVYRFDDNEDYIPRTDRELADALFKEYDDLIASGHVFTEVKIPGEENQVKVNGLNEEIKKRNFTLPKGHTPFMKVGGGGSSCAKCKFISYKDNSHICTNKYYQNWEETDKLPEDINNYCSDWFEPKVDQGTMEQGGEILKSSFSSDNQRQEDEDDKIFESQFGKRS